MEGRSFYMRRHAYGILLLTQHAGRAVGRGEESSTARLIRCGKSNKKAITLEFIRKSQAGSSFRHGAYGIRTHGLNNANVARSQLR